MSRSAAAARSPHRVFFKYSATDHRSSFACLPSSSCNITMSSSVTQDASSHPPPSHGHSSDHDSSGDECERFGSFCQVQVVNVAAVTAASLTSASSVTSIAASKAGDASDKMEHVETPYDGFKLKIACMPVLRLKVHRLPPLAPPIFLPYRYRCLRSV